MNRGTKKHPYAELSERMAFVPFQFVPSGGAKGFGFSGYSLIEDVDEMMETGREIVLEPAFDNEQIEKVRETQARQAKTRFQKTEMQAFYSMFNHLFEGHPLSQTYSTEESIKNITKEDLIALHKKYLRPENLTMYMVGDKTPEEMKVLANKYFGQWKAEGEKFEISVTPPVKPLTDKSLKVFTENDATECTVNIGFAPFNNIPPEEGEALSALNYILAGSALTSRMGIELRDKQGLIYGIKSELWVKGDNIGYWKFNTKTAPKNTEKVISGIFSEIRKLLDGGITDEELKAAKNRQLGLLPFYVESAGDVSNIAIDLVNKKLPFEFFDKKTDRIVSLTKEDLMKVARKYFTLDHFVIVVDGPIEEHSLDHLINKL